VHLWRNLFRKVKCYHRLKETRAWRSTTRKFAESEASPVPLDQVAVLDLLTTSLSKNRLQKNQTTETNVNSFSDFLDNKSEIIRYNEKMLGRIVNARQVNLKGHRGLI